MVGPVTLGVKLLRPGAKVPVRAHPTDSGADCFAAVPVWCYAQEPTRVPLGFGCRIPDHCELQVRGKSGMSLRGISLSFGTVDNGYTGEVCAIVTCAQDVVFAVGDVVCQIVVAPVIIPEIVEIYELPVTQRGVGGFGSTGGGA